MKPRGIAAFVCVAAAFAVLGCGDGGSDHNASVLDAAENSASSADEVLATLDASLNLASYAGVDNTFSPDGNGCVPDDLQGPDEQCCSLDVLVGDDLEQAQQFGEDNLVLAPDESYGVDVGTFVGTDDATCLEPVINVVEGSG